MHRAGIGVGDGNLVPTEPAKLLPNGKTARRPESEIEILVGHARALLAAGDAKIPIRGHAGHERHVDALADLVLHRAVDVATRDGVVAISGDGGDVGGAIRAAEALLDDGRFSADSLSVTDQVVLVLLVEIYAQRNGILPEAHAEAEIMTVAGDAGDQAVVRIEKTGRQRRVVGPAAEDRKPR